MCCGAWHEKIVMFWRRNQVHVKGGKNGRPDVSKLFKPFFFPMEKCLLTIHLFPLGALPGGRQTRQTHVQGWELELRWELL